jgi:hypothetical protein
MTENYYIRCSRTDIDLCEPVVSKDEMEKILKSVDYYIRQLQADGTRPTITLDFEHLQVVDYGVFDRVTDGQREHIRQLHSDAPVRSEELVFLALRSIISFDWEMPKSEDDIRRVPLPPEKPLGSNAGYKPAQGIRSAARRAGSGARSILPAWR